MDTLKAEQAPLSAGAPLLRGAEILVKALQAENVQYIWGYPGGAVLHIYDAIYKQDTMQHVLVRHEQAAVHAADGFARAGAALAGLGLPAAIIQEGGYNVDEIGGLLARFLGGWGG